MERYLLNTHFDDYKLIDTPTPSGHKYGNAHIGVEFLWRASKLDTN